MNEAPMDNKIENVRVSISEADMKDGKNVDGSKGKICNNCGGYGYTMALKGGRLPCTQCEQTGAQEMTMRELQTIVVGVAGDLQLLRKALLETLQSHGKTINLKEKENG